MTYPEARLGAVTTIVNGGTPDTKCAAYWDDGIAWLTPKDMGKSQSPHTQKTSRTISKVGLHNCSARIVPAGSVILSTRAPIGHLAINDVEMAFNQGCRGLIPSSRLNAKFLYYFLQANVRLLNDLGTGTTFKELSAGALANVQIPLPPLAEQQRIVAILDEAFEGIDAAIANAERASANGTALFAAARKSLFAKRESSWTDQPIAAICENLDGRRRPVTKRDRVPGDVPYYGASGVVDHVQTKLFDEDLLLVSEDGANLLARTYPIAFSIAGPSWVNNHAHVLRFADARTQKFVEHFFNSIDLEPYVTGMPQPKLNQGVLNKISVPLPPLDRQGDIVTSLERLQSTTNNLMDLRSRKLTLLAELKQSLLARAFAGELTATVALIVNDNNFATPEQAANILAFMYWRHERANRGRFFGHVMGQKTLDLVERVGCVELGRAPYKDAAGPNDRAHMIAAERWAKQQGFFEFVERSGGGYDFKKLSNHSAMLTAAKTALKPIEMQLAQVTDILLGKDTVEAEVFDTVLAAWNNLVADGAEASDAAIIHEARENWHPDKLAIPISKFQGAVQEVRRRGLVPDGTAKVVRHRQASLL